MSQGSNAAPRRRVQAAAERRSNTTARAGSTPRNRGRVAPTSAASLLQLMWLASPALPVGGFSYSEGLEAAVEAGLVTNEAQAGPWLLDQLHLSLARSDIAVMRKAFAVWQRADSAPGAAHIAELNAWVTTTRETHEMRQQTEQMGRSLVEWLKNRGGADDPRVAVLKALTPAPTWPIAFALAAAQTGAPLRDALLSYSFGWAENMVQAALKSVPLGQSAGQRILAALSSEIPAAVDHATTLMDSERQAFTPMLAILSAQHEAQYSRLFRS
ncbi:urease accessory protein UreF [soil metagenome]